LIVSDEFRSKRLSMSDTCALIFVALVACGQGFLLDSLAGGLGSVYEEFYPTTLPEATALPALTLLALKFPFLLSGGIVAVLAGWLAFPLRNRDWVQRNLVLLVSMLWAASGLIAFAGLVGFIVPMITVFGFT
jgi:hypothetical protein